MRVLFIIRSLEVGGAEQQLLTLVSGLPAERFEITVATFYSGGAMVPRFQALKHVRVVSLGKRGRWDLARFGWRCLRLVAKLRPHVIHGYMSGANELAAILARSQGCRCVWGIRVSDQDWNAYSRFRRLVFGAGVHLSRLADLIVSNSHSGRDWHLKAGYSGKSFIVIPNGVDLERFKADEQAGRRWRQQHGIDPLARVVLLPARWDPMKDHPCFLRAAAVLLSRSGDGPPVIFVCLGGGSAAYGTYLAELTQSLGIQDAVRFWPAERDIPAAYNAADIVASTSAFGEGFPNVIGEAMACGRIVTATDCGDAKVVIGDPAFVTPVGDTESLARVWSAILGWTPKERAERGQSNAVRIRAEFGPDRLVERTSAALCRLVPAGEQG